MPRSDWNLVRIYEFLLPPLKEQAAIAEVLSDMDAEIAALEARRAKTQAIKQGMLQQLLTGKVRLVAAAQQTEAVLEEPSQEQASGAQGHNVAFNEAVVISTLVDLFSSEQYPLGRMRYTKLAYLLHRYIEKKPEGYLKKAAGPYNPATRYEGAEKIAQKNRYVCSHQSGKYAGFIAAENIAQARAYFKKWYGDQVVQWLEQFRRVPNETLELWATVDMAAQELRDNAQSVTVAAVKQILQANEEWRPKLARPIFSDFNIRQAIGKRDKLFGSA